MKTILFSKNISHNSIHKGDLLCVGIMESGRVSKLLTITQEIINIAHTDFLNDHNFLFCLISIISFINVILFCWISSCKPHCCMLYERKYT